MEVGCSLIRVGLPEEVAVEPRMEEERSRRAAWEKRVTSQPLGAAGPFMGQS